MGADLLVAYLTINRGKTSDWKAGQRKITELATTPLKQWPGDYLNDRGIDPKDKSEDRQAYVDELESGLHDLQKAWDDQFRDIVLFDVSEKVVLLSGGISWWGDDPTESYAMIWRLQLSGVAKACGFDG